MFQSKYPICRKTDLFVLVFYRIGAESGVRVLMGQVSEQHWSNLQQSACLIHSVLEAVLQNKNSAQEIGMKLTHLPNCIYAQFKSKKN